jgi:hypothetical protein
MKVFISHSSEDKRFVRKLKEDLNENNIETWVDEDELRLGDSLLQSLEAALEKSSHFLIVLSNASIDSPWVKIEIEEALNQSKSNAMKKVIPIKYKDCEIPNSLKNLLFADLSNETREVIRDKVQFNGDGYQKFLDRLCQSLNNPDKKLTEEDKKVLKVEIKNEEIKIDKSLEIQSIVKANYRVLAYKNKETRIGYTKRILQSGSKIDIHPINIKPILLPLSLKKVLDIKLGDEIYFSKNFSLNEIGHFAGFRKDDLAIAIDSRIRSVLKIYRSRIYSVEIDVKNIRINFFI